MFVRPGLKKLERAAGGVNHGMPRSPHINRSLSPSRRKIRLNSSFFDRQKVFTHKHGELKEIFLLHKLQYRLSQFKVGQDMPPPESPLHDRVAAEIRRFNPAARAASGVSQIDELEPQLDQLRVELLGDLLEINRSLARDDRAFKIGVEIDPNSSHDTGFRSLLGPMGYSPLRFRQRHMAFRYYLRGQIEELETAVENYEEFLKSDAIPGNMIKDAYSRFARDLLAIANEISQRDDKASEFLVEHTLGIMESIIVDLRRGQIQN